MATLLQLKQIEIDSRSDPAVAAGDVLLAIELRRKVETELWKRATDFLTGSSLPADPQERNEAIGFAQKVLRHSERLSVEVLRIALAQNASATVAQILGATDAQISSNIGNVITLYARGLHPGQA